jgi:hypothetical protein
MLRMEQMQLMLQTVQVQAKTKTMYGLFFKRIIKKLKYFFDWIKFKLKK